MLCFSQLPSAAYSWPYWSARDPFRTFHQTHQLSISGEKPRKPIEEFTFTSKSTELLYKSRDTENSTSYEPAAMSSAAATSSCSPNSVPTNFPDIDMTTEWCAVPEQGNLTTMAMQGCCTSDDIQSISGCAVCYTQDPDAEDATEFNQQFSQCISRGLKHRNASSPDVAYCNTPIFSSAAQSHRGWSVWSVAILIGTSSVFQCFA